MSDATARRRFRAGAAFGFLLGVLVATYLHWPALTDPLIYKSDVRQSPHWAKYHLDDAFRDDDLLVLYGSFNESPVQNLIYWVGTFVVDYVWLTKIVAVLVYGFYGALFYALTARMFTQRAGLLAAIFVLLFPDQFEYAAGGFSKMWMIPLLLVAVWIVQTRRWRRLWWLMPFAALAYPVCAVLIGATASVGVALEWLRHRSFAQLRRDAFELAVGSALGVLPLIVKYLRTPSEVGPMASRAELFASPAMYRGGLSPYLPTPSLLEAFEKLLWHPFLIGGAILFILVLRRRLVWARGWTALLVASVVCYVIADLVFLKLYFPNRYLRYSIGALLPLWQATNLDLVLQRLPSRAWRAAALTAVVAVGLVLFADTLEMGKDTIERHHRAPLSRFLATLPGDILVAGHPWDMDDIPVQARRSVLMNYKMNHAWFVTYRDEIDRRTRDSFRALYARGPADVDLLHERYGVTHFVVSTRYFERRRIARDKVYREPYEAFIRELTRGRRGFWLEDPPADRTIWQDGGQYVIELPIGRGRDRERGAP